MRKLTILAIQIILGCGFLSLSFAEPQPLLPPIDAELIIAGLEHSESLLKSGRGRSKLYMSDYFEKGKEILDEKKEIDPKTGAIRVTERSRSTDELWFAFSGKHSYFKDLNEKVEVISDGRIQLIIPPSDRVLPVASQVVFRNPFPYFPLGFHRDWELWYNRQKLSDYLRQQKQVRVIGSEKVDGIPCYIIEVSDSKLQDAIVKYWIAPEKGFSLVQILIETKTEKHSTKVEWQGYKIGEKDKDVVWFPKHAVGFFMKSGTEKAFKNEMEITDFQPNIDTSHFFDLQNRFLPETKVFNTEIGKFTTFKEIGWQKFESTLK